MSLEKRNVNFCGGNSSVLLYCLDVFLNACFCGIKYVDGKFLIWFHFCCHLTVFVNQLVNHDVSLLLLCRKSFWFLIKLSLIYKMQISESSVNRRQDDLK